MKKQKTKLKTQNIFIVINIVIIVLITCFYAYRLIHYYRIEHPKLEKKSTLTSLVTLKKNITSVGNGLYKEGDSYVYRGTDVDNYLEYSGFLFRIVSVNSNGDVKVITEDSLTNLAWGIDDDYKSSYVSSWLNGSSENEGIFYNSLNDPDKYLVDSTFCIGQLKEDSIKCEDENTDKVGLLSLLEYNDANGSKSYLNNDNYWWLSNPSNNGIWYVYDDGELNDDIYLGQDYYSYGVRPVITIKGTIEVVSGDGTKDKPFVLETETENLLKNKSVGKYVRYSNLNWRIIEKNENYVRVALDGFIEKDSEPYMRIYSNNSTIYSAKSDIGYYLNNVFYSELDDKYMEMGTIYTNRYDSTVDFDYSKIFNATETAKVGLMQVGDLFMNDYDDYFLVSRTSTYVGTVYKVIKNNMLYADLPTNKAKLRPVIFLDLESPITAGDGSKKNPYIIG